MPVPEHLWRFPTAASVASLAQRFNLPNRPDMQDWPWEVADAGRLDEFLAAYETANLTDDERFTLMEILLQSFEDQARTNGFDQRWTRTLNALERNIDLHAYSLWYWSDVENELEDDQWLVTPHLRKLLNKHLSRLAPP